VTRVTRPRHDLDAILLDALGLFAPLPHTIHIAWVDLDAVDTAVFAEHRDWASCTGTREGLFIGIHPMLAIAPRRVVAFVVAHEVLHLAIPPRRGVHHHHDFCVAERLLPGYLPARLWLDAHADV
jgi:hypothetical protein